MCVRTDTGFDYGEEGFVTFEEAVEELTDSLCDSDDEGMFSREEQREYAQFIIDNCEDGAYH